MSVKLRLTRKGKTKQPTYRIVAADARSKRDGAFIEIQPRERIAKRVPAASSGTQRKSFRLLKVTARSAFSRVILFSVRSSGQVWERKHSTSERKVRI